MPRTLALVLLACMSTIVIAADKKGPQANPGYTDTPFIPGTKWRVHDANRPRPKWVDTGESPTLGQKPPKGVVVLFDGSNLDAWTGRGGKANWKVENGYFEVKPKTGQISTKQKFGSFKLHIEWAAPKEVKGHSQGRGNSGVFLQGKYEVQVLDSYKNPTYADGQASAIYGQYPPDVNAMRPPGEWNTYDITFKQPKFDKGKVVRKAVVTVVHNGETVHNNREIMGGATHKRVAKYSPHGEGPIGLQDHGNPVRFRNVWLVPLDD